MSWNFDNLIEQTSSLLVRFFEHASRQSWFAVKTMQNTIIHTFPSISCESSLYYYTSSTTTSINLIAVLKIAFFLFLFLMILLHGLVKVKYLSLCWLSCLSFSSNGFTGCLPGIHILIKYVTIKVKSFRNLFIFTDCFTIKIVLKGPLFRRKERAQLQIERLIQLRIFGSFPFIYHR